MDDAVICSCLSVMCILKISNQANQDLVRNAEQFGQLLARTLSEAIPETIKSRSNVGTYVHIHCVNTPTYVSTINHYYTFSVIKAQITTSDDIKNLKGSPLKFPDEDDMKLINNSFNGLNAQVLIPNQLLNKAIDATST